MKYTDEELRRIGKNLMSLWGAECISYEVGEKCVEFTGIEDGDQFTSELSFDNLKEYLY